MLFRFKTSDGDAYVVATDVISFHTGACPSGSETIVTTKHKKWITTENLQSIVARFNAHEWDSVKEWTP